MILHDTVGGIDFPRYPTPEMKFDDKKIGATSSDQSKLINGNVQIGWVSEGLRNARPMSSLSSSQGNSLPS